MTTKELHRTDGGPLERSHMKDMVQRNALENAAYHKVAKHLESQKKAFVRQNTRDEEEMKNLLYRLQTEQQTTLTDDGVSSDDDNNGHDEVDGIGIYSPLCGRLEPECIANPYPVTIIPRFGGAPHAKQPVATKDAIKCPDSFRGRYRRKSVEYEDIQESLSAMTVSGLSSVSTISEQIISGSATNLSYDEHASRDWLATPGAISSVRRMRKSVTAQAHQRILRKTSAEYSDSCHFYPNSPPHSRSNSLKDRNKSTSSEMTSPRQSLVSRRGGSLKERKTSKTDRTDHAIAQPLSRSYSMLTKSALSEFNRKQESTCSKLAPETSTETNEEGTKIKRKNSKKSEKHIGLSKKKSIESTTLIDVSSPRRKPNVLRKLGIAGSPDSSPVLSPLARDSEIFKFGQ